VKRITVLLAGVAAVAAVLGTTAHAKPAPGAKFQLRQTSLGKVLVDKAGFTLYVFTHDSKNRDTCVKISGCTGTWPVIKTKGKPVAGRGVKASLLGTITLAHGVKQVTYAGHPLYGYVGDSGPGQTDYVGQSQFGGTWYAINANGKVVR
jgi:predicted lipoprotein with Yx(FWY)xxD motif